MLLLIFVGYTSGCHASQASVHQRIEQLSQNPEAAHHPVRFRVGSLTGEECIQVQPPGPGVTTHQVIDK